MDQCGCSVIFSVFSVDCCYFPALGFDLFSKQFWILNHSRFLCEILTHLILSWWWKKGQKTDLLAHTHTFHHCFLWENILLFSHSLMWFPWLNLTEQKRVRCSWKLVMVSDGGWKWQRLKVKSRQQCRWQEGDIWLPGFKTDPKSY